MMMNGIDRVISGSSVVRFVLSKKMFLLSFYCSLLVSWFAGADQGVDSTRIFSKRRDVEIHIQTGGDVAVTEVWEMFFPERNRPFHKGYREILLEKIDRVEDWHVFERKISQRSGQDSPFPEDVPLEIEVKDRGDASQCTWFFPETIHETKTFVIRYTLRGVLRVDEWGDELFYTIVEPGRAYSVFETAVTILFPSDVPEKQIRVADYQNGTEIKGEYRLDGRRLRIGHGILLSNERWAIRVRVPHAVLFGTESDWQRREKRRAWMDFATLVGSVVVLLGGSLFVFLLWHRKGRDAPSKELGGIVSDIPDATPPGMVGVVLDRKVRFRHVLATILDLARRGFFDIQQQTSKNAVFRRRSAHQGDHLLLPYERKVLTALFKRKTRVTLLSLRYRFGREMKEIKEALSLEAANQGYFAEEPEGIRSKYATVGVLGLALSAVFGPLLFILFGWPLPGAFVFVFILLVIVSRSMPKRTEKGMLSLARWRSFLLYLKKLKSYKNVAQAQNAFETWLPYAVALGEEKALVETFSVMQITSPSWYSSENTVTSADASWLSSKGQPGGDVAPAAFGVDSMSRGLFSMLDSASSVLTDTRKESSSSSSFDSGGGSDSGGGDSGGGSSGFD